MEKYYRILELNRSAATEEDVKRAYRKQALLVHPDRNPQGGEAFKALQDAYEAALADVKRGTNQHRGVGGWSRDTANASAGPSSSTFFSFTTSTAAGAAYSYARASASTRGTEDANPRSHHRPAPSPLFSEAELFGDAVPGGWRDVGAQQRSAQPDEKPLRYGGGTTANESASASESRWRRAHGSRVPLSAYEGAGPVPPPPRSSGKEAPFPSAPTHPPRRPPSPSSPAAAASSSMGKQQQQPQQQQPPPPLSTQAQWEAFLAQHHLWHTSASPPSSPQGSSEDESAEDRAVREALYLHRRAQELHRKAAHPPPGGLPRHAEREPANPPPSSTTASAAPSPQPPSSAAPPAQREELYRQWQAVQNSLHRKLNGEDPQRQSGPAAEEKEEAPRAGPSAAPTTSGKSPGFASGVAPRHANVHHDALMKERRALQREYLRFRYTPDPADVGDMSDMEVYLLAELLKDVQAKVQAVLQARLTKGLCSVCGALPRSTTCQYFECNHKSVCAMCHAAGVLSCPLCGARRTSPEESDGSDLDTS